MAEYEAIIGTDDNLNVDVSADIDVPVTVTDNGFVSMSVEPDASALSVDAEVAPDEIIDVPVQEGLGGIASDHRLLLHRDAANQHPMSSIEGLEGALSDIEHTLETRILDAENDITDLALVEEADRITMANAVIRIDRDITLLQNQVDGNITTWFYDYVPTSGNPPASDWIQAGEEAVHLGDLFYNTDTGYAYRWMSDNATPPVYAWQRITDTDVTKALEDAAKAQDTADHKRRVFITTPVPPYDAGDLWFVGVSGDILTCTHGRLESESYGAGDWSKLHKYTDDTRANEAYDLANNAKLSADGKNRIYRQNSQPTGGVYGAGDVWFDTAHDNKIYRYDGSSWVAVTLGDDALDNLSANKITAGTLDASQVTVSNLDAGNITSGTLDTDRLDVNQIISDGSILVSGDDISSLNNDSGYATTSDIPTDISDLNDDVGIQTAQDVSDAISTATADMATNTGIAATYATKTSAVKSAVSLYYRSSTQTAPTIYSTTTIGTSNNTDNAWEYVMPIPKRGYYFYTCEKYTFVDDSVSFSTVRELASETYASKWVSSSDATYIDGGRLYANSVTATQIDASTITVSSFNDDIGIATQDDLPTDVSDLTDTTGVIPTDLSDLTDSQGVIPDVSGKADKTDAVARTQRIYYRKTASGAPSKNTTWLSTSGTGYGNWSLKIPQLTSGTTKYPYLYTAVQTQTVSQMSGTTCSCSDVLLDDTTTIIDGGNIITGTVNANAINASSGTFDTANIPNLNASKITAGDIAADRMKVNSITAINSLTTGKINASRLDVGSITVGSLSDGSNYSTTSQINTAIGNAVDNIDVGGRNLLKVNGSSTSKNTYRFADIPLTEPLVAGEEYTLQLWGISLDANSTGIGAYWGSGNNNLCTFARQNGHLTNTFTVTSAQASHADASNLTIYLYSYPSGRSDYNTSITKWKLEKGNKATDWSQAPEDILNDNLLIDSQKMGSWQIGTNASLDSSGEFGVATITGNTSWTGVIYSKPTISASILDGSPLWLSFEYQYSEATAIAVALAGTSAAVDSTTSITRTKYLTKYPVLKSTNTWTKYSIQMPSTVAELTSGSGDVNSLYVQFYNYYTANSTLKIRKVKLEHGIASSDWTPSPQDQKAYITRISDTGIRIHPASTQNNSVVINADGMEVFKGGTGSANSVAFYGNTARIGKTSDYNIQTSDSAIKFYKNNVYVGSIISYQDSATRGMAIQSDPSADGSADLSFIVLPTLHTATMWLSSNSANDFAEAKITATNTQTSQGSGINVQVNRVGISSALIDINGALEVSGNITVGDHSSAIGTVINAYPSAAVSVADKTGTAITSVTLDAGTWLVTCGVRAPTNATGYRIANLSTTSGSSENNVSQTAVSGQPTQQRFAVVLPLTATTTYYLNAYHNAGTTLSYPAGGSGHTNFIRAVRLI